MSWRLNCLLRLSTSMVAAMLASCWFLTPGFSFAAEPGTEPRKPFVLRLAEELGCTESEAEEKLGVVFQAISVELVAGQSVTVPNFGRFFVYEKQVVEGEGEPTRVSARRVTQSSKQRARRAGRTVAKRFPRFRASEVLKASLNPELATERNEAH